MMGRAFRQRQGADATCPRGSASCRESLTRVRATGEGNDAPHAKRVLGPYGRHVQIRKAMNRSVGILAVLVKDPVQVRYLPAWARALRRSTVESRLPWLPFQVIERLDQRLSRD